ncbi:hypothetical protein SLA2020_285200 [Shorea laevis]
MIILGLGKLDNDLYEEILKRFDGIWEIAPWKTFIQTLCGNMALKLPHATMPDNSSDSPRMLSLLLTLNEALVNTYGAEWKKEKDYISPGCFLYLVERLMMLASYSQGYFITSKSSFAEWFIYQEEDTNPDSTSMAKVQPFLGRIYNFVVNDVVKSLVFNKEDTMEWIKMSGLYPKDYPLLMLRLVSIICLVHLNNGNCSDLLFDLLRRSNITEQLPLEFCDVLRRRRKDFHKNVNVLAEAFNKINNPLVIVSLGKDCSQFLCPDAIFVDMTVKQRREDMVRVLFPKTVKAMQGQTGIVEVEATNSCSEVVSSNFALTSINAGMLPMNCSDFWEMFEALKSLENGRDPKSFLSNAGVMKVSVDKSIHLVTVLNESLENTDCDDESLLHEVTGMLDELKLLSAALDVSEPELGNNMSKIVELSKRLQSRERVEALISDVELRMVETSAKINTSADKGKSKALEAHKNSKETENKGKGNKSKKKKTGKGGRKR